MEKDLNPFKTKMMRGKLFTHSPGAFMRVAEVVKVVVILFTSVHQTLGERSLTVDMGMTFTPNQPLHEGNRGRV